MNKTEFTNAVINETHIEPLVVERIMNAMMKVATEELIEGGQIQITGFGTLMKTFRTEKDARNPKTGEMLKVPAQYSAKFKAGANLKRALNS